MPVELFPYGLLNIWNHSHGTDQPIREHIKIVFGLLHLVEDFSDESRFTLGDPVYVLKYMHIGKLCIADAQQLTQKILSTIPDFFHNIPDHRVIAFIDQVINDFSPLLLFVLRLLPPLATSVQGSQYNTLISRSSATHCLPIMAELHRLGFVPSSSVYRSIMSDVSNLHDIELLINYFESNNVFMSKHEIYTLQSQLFYKSYHRIHNFDIFWLCLEEFKPTTSLFLYILEQYYANTNPNHQFVSRLFSGILSKLILMYPELSACVTKCIAMLQHIRMILSEAHILVGPDSKVLAGLFDDILVRREHNVCLHGLMHDNFAYSFVADLYLYLEKTDKDAIVASVKKASCDEYIGTDMNTMMQLMNTTVLPSHDMYKEVRHQQRLNKIAMLRDLLASFSR